MNSRGVSQLADATQRTILFLIADTGAGHRSAANAISNAMRIISEQEQAEWKAGRERMLTKSEVGDEPVGNVGDQAIAAMVAESAPPNYRIEIVDVFQEYSHFPLREAMKLYGPTIRYNPRLYGELFHQSNKEAGIKTVNALGTPLIFNGLLRLITTIQPDIIVSVHPLVNFVTIRALRQLGLRIPFIIVVTDLVSVHHSWFTQGADAYIVPTEQAKQISIQRSLDPKRVFMLGMPIDPKFTRAVAERAELWKRFELQPGVPVVLLVGGGDGAGGLQTAVRAISQARLPVQLLVVTGRNKRLYAQLQRTRQRLHVPTKIFGFVQNMPELMHAADVIITKAGPGTICEALSCHLPIILSGYVPGQEEGNVDYVVKNEMGVLALNASTLIDELRRYVRPGSMETKKALENEQRLSRPFASFDIARKVLSYLPASDVSSVWQSHDSLLIKRRMSGRLRSSIRIRRQRGRLPRTLIPRTARRTVLRIRRRTRDISGEAGKTRD